MTSESDNRWTLDGGTVMDYCGRDEALRTLPQPGAKPLLLSINVAGMLPNIICDFGKVSIRNTSGSVCYYLVTKLTHSPLFKTLDT
jgi:hypothetical protein